MSLPRVLSGRRRLRFAYLVANGVCQAGVAVATALLVKQGFDQLIANPGAAGAAGSANAMLLFGAGLLGAILAGAWLRWRGHLDAEILGQSYVHAVRMTLFRHVAGIGADGARQMSRGAIVLRFVGDLTALRNWVSLGLARLTVSGLATALAIGALAFAEPVVAIAVAVAVTCAGTLAFAIGPRLRTTMRESRRRRGRLAALLNDRVTHIGVVEAFGQEQKEGRRFQRLSRKLRDSLVVRARAIGLLRALSEASGALASTAALFVGALQVELGQASPGAVVAAMVVAGLLAPRLQDLGRVYEYWNGALIAREKQERLLALAPVGRPKRGSEGEALAEGSGTISLQSVSYEPVLKQVSMTIDAGERVAVVGPNGAGKSTLLRLVAGLLHPDAGQVLLDGQDIAETRWPDLRRAFAFVSPDLPLLRGSLRLNLSYGGASPPDEEIVAMLERLGLSALLARLPKGLDSRISEHGAGFSTGERARLALARALLAKPRVLLLDEADANLDGRANRLLEDAVALFEGSVMFISHDPARAAKADRILRLAEGTLSALDPAQLLAALPNTPSSAAPRSLSSNAE